MIFISILIFIMAIAIPSFRVQLSPILLTRISAIILIYSGVLSFNALYIQSIGSGIGIYSGLFYVSSISQLLDSFLLFIGALILIPRPAISFPSFSTSSVLPVLDQVSGKYSLIILFSTLGSLLLISSSDLLSMYLSIELQSFGLYILSTLYRDSKSATSAGLKYFLLGGFSSCIILLGAGLVYSYTGLTNLESIYSLMSVSNSIDGLTESLYSNIQGLYLGIILILLGFLFKVAAAPLHNWAPDVYDESPTIVTVWLTIMPKLAIFTFLFISFQTPFLPELSINTFPLFTIENPIQQLLLISSLFSLIIGTVVGLAQSKLKRLLAYSTISHVGFLLLAFAVNSEQSSESFIFYLIQYSITNLNAFLIILALGYLIVNPSTQMKTKEFNLENKDIRFISELKGQFTENPLLSISLAICLFSMAGIPPLIGFFGKQMVLYSSIQGGYYFMSLVAIIVSVISASYYLKIVRILFETNYQPSHLDISQETTILQSSHSFVISTLTLTILLFVLKPSLLLNSTQLLSLTLFQT